MSTTMLYRPAEDPNPQAWNLPLEHRVFADEDVPHALSEGWVRHPDDLNGDMPADPTPKRKGRPPKEA